MWTRYSRSLSQNKPETNKTPYRDLLQTQRQSLGFRQLEKIKIDCTFLPTSKWGILGSHPGSPAWLLYLQFQFSQPPGCKVANASIELLFEKINSSDNVPLSEARLGPILTEHFGPRGVDGGRLNNHRLQAASEHHSHSSAPSLKHGSLRYCQERNSQWSLHSYTWPVDYDKSGLHRRVEWILTEGDHPHTAILQRDQLHVGLVLLHDSEPFSLSVRIEGQLQSAQRWYKFSRAPEARRNQSIRVQPTLRQTPLDAIAESLDKDMTDLLLRGHRVKSNVFQESTSQDSHVHVNSQIRNTSLEGNSASHPTLATASRTYDSYTVGWICALPLEMAAAKAMMQEVHPNLQIPPNDTNNYILGNIGPHNIVVACLPAGVYGITSAATVGTRMLATFPSLRFSLMVGIGAGVPAIGADIRLGDVVVSKPTLRSGGVVQYDYGKALLTGIFDQTGSLNKPPLVLLTTLARMQAEHIVCGHRLVTLIDEMTAKYPQLTGFTRPQEDLLFNADYLHQEDSISCDTCDRNQCVGRPPRSTDDPVIHYGSIASGNQVIKCAKTRDRLAQQHGIICFEMEAAGLMDSVPCLVIRGICDYADSHKNKEWQNYAAAAAAAYAKEFLLMTPARQVEITPKAT